jgi:hypothetical protein
MRTPNLHHVTGHHHELHARPPDALDIPEQASNLALATDPSKRQAEYERIVELCTRYGVPSPARLLSSGASSRR